MIKYHEAGKSRKERLMGNDKWKDPNYMYQEGDEFGEGEIPPEESWGYEPPDSGFIWSFKLLGLIILLIVLIIGGIYGGWRYHVDASKKAIYEHQEEVQKNNE